MLIFKKLKLKGFKSFVDPTELLIEPGLTGVVGPNGCGKSNLVEALRFVMGELSPKQMRGSDLDDVIFNGTATKSAWDIAEVTIELDNKDRKAPVIFNDRDEIEVTRRIWRGEGSEYKVNGKEVRLRDVQLLFADSATGARSTSLVSQGRISALISAKPEQRRLLLEEAAGITGLHTRRHEAELRLNAAGTNLDRVKDVLAEQESQLAVLKKQSRQAVRYRNIQDDIKRAEAALFYQRWMDAKAIIEKDQKKLEDHINLVNNQTNIVAQSNIKLENQMNKLPDLREKDSNISAELQKNNLNLDNYKTERERISKTVEDLKVRIDQINEDLKRESALASEANINIAKIKEEREKLEQQQDLFPEKTEGGEKIRFTKPIIDYLNFEDGLERAIASVFGEDLMASVDENQPSHWKKFSLPFFKNSFPSEVTPLSNLVKAPENLQKSLSSIGLIKDKESAEKIQKNLKDGQVLVSEEGEIWRWDGFTSSGKESNSVIAVVAHLKTRRMKELSNEESSWYEIMKGAKKRVEDLEIRQNDLHKELENLKLKPNEITSEETKLLSLIDEIKKNKDQSSQNIIRAEEESNKINKELKLEEVKLGDLREEKVRLEGIIDTHNESLKQLIERIKERLNCSPSELLEMGQINLSNPLPETSVLEGKLQKLNEERERLGGVNLLAEQEAEELEKVVNSSKKDRDDLLKAIAKLRDGILQLNKEGRQRLLASYGVVNENFQKLFTRLFGGGKAYLKFTDDGDPLESGLDVFASPPGKKLQNLSLLSGGEQALTALSLLFAVFLSNPAPICVLDEVDAPLDDTNVDRFCSLVQEITNSSRTKFVIVTHHRMTMARVNRLFGVTMPEQGISRLVSVELEEAERIRER
ncbi:MAG: Chromosome partition protein Smc [Alphaproteobacteria bacterium MarineAlpha5_Bin11]|nr:MAG: Chromosome partition protein Smc [Alphaproteobacteria bacterium MarineAlpha5_Bin11]PPR52221.1 MAG: Chromosome partition protein Smc [Alphaproteobacteria bacterium MarineAlpha5_Bin10]|tara:strand:- start:13207 stop:15822 length:2616 start_codon:yes stop_codon:yes gene_type:complete